MLVNVGRETGTSWRNDVKFKRSCNTCNVKSALICIRVWNLKRCTTDEQPYSHFKLNLSFFIHVFTSHTQLFTKHLKLHVRELEFPWIRSLSLMRSSLDLYFTIIIPAKKKVLS